MLMYSLEWKHKRQSEFSMYGNLIQIRTLVLTRIKTSSALSTGVQQHQGMGTSGWPLRYEHSEGWRWWILMLPGTMESTGGAIIAPLCVPP